MDKEYLIYGAELSPYSVKVRSYFRYKEIPHKWIVRNAATQKDFDKLAKIQVVPLVVTPEGKVLQDSTPVIQKMEQVFTQKSITPKESETAFISRLIEEYADEWAVKQMFHYRWRYPNDQNYASQRFGELFVPDWANKIPLLNTILKQVFASIFKKRMRSRLWVIGSNRITEGSIEESFSNLINLLNKHLEKRKYLFGERPALADFALWGQVYNAWTDVTGKKIIEADSHNVKRWIDRMLEPKKEGDFEQWASLEDTLMPILVTEVAQTFLPWVVANNKAIKNGDDHLSITLNSKLFEHKVTSVQKYHAKSFTALLSEYSDIPDKNKLNRLLEEAGILGFLEE